MSRFMSDEKPAPPDALAVAIKFLSYRDRSVKEVRERLRARGYASVDISRSVDYLIEADLLDDKRFAATLAASRLRNKNWGAAKITSELLSKGVSREIAQKTLSSFDEDVEKEAALRALTKWSRKNKCSLKGGAKAETLRAVRHLKARGFSPPLIIKV
ncbi:MAG: regulatory protein RecX, partial [Thermodesulfobacteriota bacterium]